MAEKEKRRKGEEKEEKRGSGRRDGAAEGTNRLIVQALIKMRMTGPTELTLACDGYEPLKIKPIMTTDIRRDKIKFK